MKEAGAGEGVGAATAEKTEKVAAKMVDGSGLKFRGIVQE